MWLPEPGYRVVTFSRYYHPYDLNGAANLNVHQRHRMKTQAGRPGFMNVEYNAADNQYVRRSSAAVDVGSNVTGAVVRTTQDIPLGDRFTAGIRIFKLGTTAATHCALCLYVPNTAIGQYGNGDLVELLVSHPGGGSAVTVLVRRLSVDGTVQELVPSTNVSMANNTGRIFLLIVDWPGFVVHSSPLNPVGTHDVPHPLGNPLLEWPMILRGEFPSTVVRRASHRRMGFHMGTSNIAGSLALLSWWAVQPAIYDTPSGSVSRNARPRWPYYHLGFR